MIKGVSTEILHYYVFKGTITKLQDCWARTPGNAVIATDSRNTPTKTVGSRTPGNAVIATDSRNTPTKTVGSRTPGNAVIATDSRNTPTKTVGQGHLGMQ